MSGQPFAPQLHSPPIGRDDVRRVLGDMDDAKIIQILSLKPSQADLEEAAMWVAGDGDILAKSGHRLGLTASTIVDIVAPDEDEEAAPMS